MKQISWKVIVSLIVRILGILVIVLLFLIVCLSGTVFVTFIVGLLFTSYFR